MTIDEFLEMLNKYMNAEAYEDLKELHWLIQRLIRHCNNDEQTLYAIMSLVYPIEDFMQKYTEYGSNDEYSVFVETEPVE